MRLRDPGRELAIELGERGGRELVPGEVREAAGEGHARVAYALC